MLQYQDGFQNFNYAVHVASVWDAVFGWNFSSVFYNPQASDSVFHMKRWRWLGENAVDYAPKTYSTATNWVCQNLVHRVI